MAIKRQIKIQVDMVKTMFPILAVTGPRQSGKTTFLRNEFKNYTYVSLENPDNRAFAQSDPNGFLKQYNKHVIIDEAQRVPELFSYLQTKVDEDNIMAQYVLSGSQNFLLLQSITQSLAGRVAMLKLFPFDFTELKRAKWFSNTDDFNTILFNGGYPGLYQRQIPATVFYSNYLQTYVQRDLSDVLNVQDLSTFRKFIQLCANRAGQQLNLNALAVDCGITQPTAKKWLSVLESSYIAYMLQPYHGNVNKRVTKTPKLYFYDTGLLCYLLKVKKPENITESQFKGALFENFIVNEYIKQAAHNSLNIEFFYWRDSNNNEVDLIWTDDESLNLVEIKATSTIMPQLFKGLNYFESIVNQTISSKTLVYGGLADQSRTGLNVKSWQSEIFSGL